MVHPTPTEASSRREILGLRYFQLYLSLRYLKSRFSAIAALLSIMFGVAVVLILLAIMGGYVERLQELIRGQESELLVVGSTRFSIPRVSRLEKILASVDNVETTAPYSETLAMYRSGSFSPCQLRGIVPEKQAAVSNLGRYALRPSELESVLEVLNSGEGDSDARATRALRLAEARLEEPDRAPLTPEEVAGLFDDAHTSGVLRMHNAEVHAELEGEIPPPMLVGLQFFLERKVFLGQLLYIVTLDPRSQSPITQEFVVAGAFKTGDFDADSQAMYVHLDFLKNFLDLYDLDLGTYLYEGVRIRLADSERLEESRERVQSVLSEAGLSPPLSVHTWMELKRNLLKAVKIEKFVNFFLLMFLLLFAGMMVLLMLTLTVIEKTRDIGVLLALGATPRGVTRIFLTNGLLLTLVGTVMGLSAGWLFCAYINPVHDWIYVQTGWQLFPPKIYNMDEIPIKIEIEEVLLSVTPPLIFGFLASIVPALWASRRDPIKAIHYE